MWNDELSEDPQADLQNVKDEVQAIAARFGFTNKIDYFEAMRVNKCRNDDNHYNYKEGENKKQFLALCKTTDWSLTKCDVASTMETLIDIIENGEPFVEKESSSESIVFEGDA